MTDPVIRAVGLGKKYNLGARGDRESYVALRDVIARGGSRLTSRLLGIDPGQTAKLTDAESEFWALRDVNFEIARGEVVGIVGRNGAGKSTLLKVLSRITEPTQGRVELRGRVASLLEVGTGFHPELTGRENIFLNGAILGMTRAEILRKFDEIVDFAGVERFLDTPVKRYSSGMYVRLAFSVAAHLEPEILIVDEVLAVGDAEFQKRCLGRMQQVSSSGRTVLLVSHNIGALLAICDKGILLDQGHLIGEGPMSAIASQYRSSAHSGAVLSPRAFDGPLRTIIFEAVNVNGTEVAHAVAVRPSVPLVIRISGHATEEVPAFKVALGLFINDVRLATLHHRPVNLASGPFSMDFMIQPEVLRPGTYDIALGGGSASDDRWCWGVDLFQIEIAEEWSETYRKEDLGLVNFQHFSQSRERMPSPERAKCVQGTAKDNRVVRMGSLP